MPRRVRQFACPVLNECRMIGIDRVPVSHLLRRIEIVDQCGDVHRRDDFGRGKFCRRHGMKQAAQAHFADWLAIPWDRSQRDWFRQCVIDVGECKQGQSCIMQRQGCCVLFAVALHIGAPPESSARIGVDAVEDLDARDGPGMFILGDSKHRNMVGRSKNKLARRSFRKLRCPLQMLVKPKWHGDSDFGAESMIQMRRP